MTSLQKQLATLANKNNSQFNLKAQKRAHSKSLLFDTNVAAAQSFESLYQLCLEGFEDLCAIDKRFCGFSRSIFSPQSRTEDRLLMTADENSSLDVTLGSFLGLVGSYLLQQPAIKALEWLVRRFRIHEHNIHSTILTFLPYHASPVFVNLLAILPRELPSLFRFLYPYMNSLKCPPRVAIIQACSRNRSLMSALNSHVLVISEARQHHERLLSLWAITTMQLLERRAGQQTTQYVEEDSLATILPLINKLLALKDDSNVLTTCYMIIIVIATKLNLNDNLIEALMVSVSESWTTDVLGNGMVCVALLADRKQTLGLSKSTLNAIRQVPELPSIVEVISRKQNVQALTDQIVESMFNENEERWPNAQIRTIEELSRRRLLSDHGSAFVRQILSSRANPISYTGAEPTSHIAFKDTGGRDLNETVLSIHSSADDQENESGRPRKRLRVADIEPASPIRQEISSLVDVTMNQGPTNFLAGKSGKLFTTLLSGFLELLHSSQDADAEFWKLSIWRTEFDPTQVSFFTYCFRMLCLPHLSEAKCSVLKACAKRMDAEWLHQHDMQRMLPYLLKGLSDESKEVRQETAALILAYKAGMSRHTGSEEKMTTERWTGDQFLNTPNHETFLSSRVVVKCIRAILCPALEECVLDPNHETLAISAALNGNGDESSAAKTSKAPLKSKQRAELFMFLAHHVLAGTNFPIKVKLLQDLCKVNKAGGKYRSYYLMPFLQQWAGASKHQIQECEEQGISETTMDCLVLEIINPRDHKSLQYLVELVHGSQEFSRDNLRRAAAARLISVWPQLGDHEDEIAKRLIMPMLNFDDAPLAGHLSCVQILRNVAIRPSALKSFLKYFLSFLKPGNEKLPLTRHVDVIRATKTLSPHENNLMSVLTFILELIESSELDGSEGMFESLFEVLRDLHEKRARTFSDLSYLQRLVFESLIKTMNAFDASKSLVRFEILSTNIDLLVESVRSTDDPKTRSTALILISRLAPKFPEEVLHSIMPIFTIISNTTLTQKDEYSMFVVDETIQKVIPCLAGTLRKQGLNLASATADILSSFAAAFDHIPPTRRIRLFWLLSTSLGVDDSLYAILASLIDRDPTNEEIKRFSTALLREFPSNESLKTILAYIDLVSDSAISRMFHEKSLTRDEEGAVSHQSRVSNLLQAVPSFLCEGVGTQRLQRRSQEDDAAPENPLQMFTRIMERIIRLFATLRIENISITPCQDSLEALLSIMPFIELLGVIETLLEANEDEISRSAVKLLAERIRSYADVNEPSRKATLKMLPSLMDIIQRSNDNRTRLSALACLDLIIDRFGKTNVKAILDVTESLLTFHNVHTADKQFQELSLHCLASSIEVSRMEFIPFLQDALKIVTGALNDAMSFDSLDPGIYKASCTLFAAIIDTLPNVVPTKLLEEVLHLLQKSTRLATDEECKMNRTQVYSALAARLDLKTGLIGFAKAWHSAVEYGPATLSEHMSLVHQTIKVHSNSDVHRHLRTLFDLFMKWFDIRVITCSGERAALYDKYTVLLLEDSALDAILTLILKINDNLFRPFFIRLVDNAGFHVSDSPERINTQMLRSTTLFRMLNLLSKNLMSIATPYFGSVVEQASQILELKGSILHDDEQRLREAVLLALTSSFRHDQDEFYRSPRHFSLISLPLVSQLPILGQSNSSRHKITEFLETFAIPAITAFGATLSGSVDQLRSLNNALLNLLKPTSGSTVVTRMAAVRCEEALTKELGEEWLFLIPEMLPIISSLQEDGDERVEAATKSWIETMENVLGESLDGMLQ